MPVTTNQGVLVRDRWIEKIAREMCKRDGYDPETKVSALPGYYEMGPKGHTLVGAVIPAWHCYRPDAAIAYDTIFPLFSGPPSEL
jgi:hypothetical protein